MMRLLRYCFSVLLAAALSLATAAAPAQDWAKAMLAKSPRHGEYVTIKEPSGRALQAWVVYPEVKGKAPVVVMIHEIFGLTDWAREMADEVAEAGYIVVEPDLLSGFGPPMTSMPPSPGMAVNSAPMNPPVGAGAPAAPGMGCDPMPCREGQTPAGAHAGGQPGSVQGAMDHMHPQDGGAAFMAMSPGGTSAFPDQSAVVKAVSGLDPAIVLADLNAAADYGKRQPSASGKLFVAGFCWGGGKSFDFATHRRDLSGAFVFYGAPPPAEAMHNINAPVYGFYAGKDARISSTIPQTTTDMKAAGKTYEPVTYDGAGHGFMRAGEAPDASAENAAARAASFRRFIELLGGVH
jgi:carboxymethylenebutenolidase